MNEIWKDLVFDRNGTHFDFTGVYQISNTGLIKHLPTSMTSYKERIQKGSPDTKGYLQVQLKYNGKRHLVMVHRLVAELFLDKKDFKCDSSENRDEVDTNKLQVNHIDTDKTNNSVSNLEWCTNLYNMRHAVKNGVYDNAFPEERKIKCRETLDKYRPIAVANRIRNVREKRRVINEQ